MSLFAELNNQMVNYHFRPNRKMAQCFIINGEVIHKMVSAAQLKESDKVLEVGAGTGFLTRELLKHSKVIAVELDETLAALLREQFANEIKSGKLKLVEGSILSVKVPKFNKVVALPPYTISSELAFWLLRHDFELAVVGFQREFARKMLSVEGFKEYNSLSVLVNYHFSGEVLIENLSPENFYPKPNSFSSLVVLRRKEPEIKVKDEEKFRRFLKELFRLKNKNLSNALQKSFPFLREELGLSEEKFREKCSKLKETEKKVCFFSAEEFAGIFNELY
ncbi:MAG: ribosomal RNA small subunit methyltransferase A [Candidatus Diapherotrites archaeon]|uniref:Ribosomal RNA small subunit methyltransferase A n=1 Tax=Candidatus Iainarchaeum sp. TaxID=3101447 RepID=A0A7J4ITK6_9ARCH|nr:MAG: 16S rRNA (adenine1518-N6/adenine1519-N6)-dimethyltransferase [archaeon GW2011_AR10]MBS3059214.1 ribosomal RNA small subunit methyltransferase A [Candidatus Diapherotrites archaeon]HIH08858.1 ribosomal RNA small subunit methyltransferase A [Candidatus Diapherotrites archaeon]